MLGLKLNRVSNWGNLSHLYRLWKRLNVIHYIDMTDSSYTSVQLVWWCSSRIRETMGLGLGLQVLYNTTNYTDNVLGRFKIVIEMILQT